MRIYIFVDMEGVSGVAGSEYVLQEGRHYAQARRYYTWDINACAKGCFDAGASAVLVRDGHSCGTHALWEELDPRVEIIQGPQSARRLPFLDEYDALILLGYHARAGVAGALLEHTYSSRDVQNLWLNGRLAGEFAIDAAIAGEQGIPTIMVSGDDKVCAEAREWVPEVVACQVKTGLGTQCTRLLPMDVAHQCIEQSAMTAVGRIGEIPPLAVDHPVTLRQEMVERRAIPGELGRPGLRVIDGRTYEVTADTVEAAFFGLR